MFSGIDLSSDTATKPSLLMKQAMFNAPLGDEQKGEDPTTRALEEKIAEKLGFTCAIFFPSATMANQVAIASLCEPGNELLAAENSHIFCGETSGPAIHARVMCKAISTSTGLFTAQDIMQHYRPVRNLRCPEMMLVSIENTTSMGGGYVWPIENIREIVDYTKTLNVKLHMDGARLFNASIKTGIAINKLVMGFDAVTLCLSKGLGCPAGALLVFDKSQERKIKKLKHLMGGYLRQSGILAAAGIYALEHHISRLEEDHENALFFSKKLKELKGPIKVLNFPPQTNIVIFSWESTSISAEVFHTQCFVKGFRFSQIGENTFRAVTHLDIQKKHILKIFSFLEEICYQCGNYKNYDFQS